MRKNDNETRGAVSGETEKYDQIWSLAGGPYESGGPGKRHRRRLILNEARRLDFKTILDVGCGDGALLRHATSLNRCARVAGVDVATEAIQQAQATLPNAEFTVLDLQKDRLEDTFDLVICSEVLEHLKDDHEAAANLRKMVADGGHLIATVPAGKFMSYDRAILHLRMYSEADLAALLNGAGFEILRVVRWGFPFYSPIYRHMIDKAPRELATKTLTWKKRIAREIMNVLFFLNSSKKGDFLMMVARPSGRAPR